jgi:hypothetical protein
MIVKGNFTKLSMAIYGDVASELPSSPSAFHPPGVLLPFTPTPLSPALDPANSADPTTLTRNLLSLIHDAPPLPLVIRLMFCLKPANDDWDLPEFPYLHPDLDDDPVDFDLDYAYQLTSQPVADDVPLGVLQRFADRVADAIEPKVYFYYDYTDTPLTYCVECLLGSRHSFSGRLSTWRTPKTSYRTDTISCRDTVLT